uniref:Uncharacterized protein n=1 Tax=Rhizophora mucronata TaxID=61149 RepID=A0A2P2N5A1_RHIMU
MNGIFSFYISVPRIDNS